MTSMSLTTILGGALLVSLMTVTSSAQLPSPNDHLLSDINSVSDIRSADEPFQLDADFTIQLTTPRAGHLTYKWSAKDLWTQEITVDQYREVNLRKGDSLYIKRNISFTPVHVKELKELLAVGSIRTDRWQVKKISQRGVGGSDECIELRPSSKGEHAWKRQICIDPVTKDLLSDESRGEADFRRSEFSDYQPFGNHRYPRHMKFVVDGSTVLNVTVKSLEPASFDSALFMPPPDAIVRRECDNKTVPVPLKTPDPIYPPTAAQNGISGTSTVSLTVLPNGSVDNVQLIGSSMRDMDYVSQQIVKTWKFKPATCGSEPIAFDLQVIVHFRMR